MGLNKLMEEVSVSSYGLNHAQNPKASWTTKKLQSETNEVTT